MKDDGKSEMSCRGLVSLLCDYLEGDVTADERDDLEEHTEECPPCLAFLNTYRKTSELCRSLRPEDIPADLREKLLQILNKREPG